MAASGSEGAPSDIPAGTPFAQYPFEKDPRWEKYFRSFECPSELPEQEFQYRIKRKFYDRFVSKTSSSTDSPTPSASTNASTTSDTSTSHRGSTTTSSGTTNNTTGATSTNQNTTTNQTTPAAGGSTLFDFSPARIPEKIWLFSGLSMLLHGVLCLVPIFFGPETNQSIFRRFLFSAAANFGVSLFQAHGIPQFNMPFF